MEEVSIAGCTDKSKEEPVHHTIGHWQNYGYLFFHSEAALIFDMFSEYDTDSTKNSSTFTDKINPSGARFDLIFLKK